MLSWLWTCCSRTKVVRVKQRIDKSPCGYSTWRAGSVRKHLTSCGKGRGEDGGAWDRASNDSTAAGGELSSIDSAVNLPVADQRSENCTRNRCFTMFIMRWYSLHENCDEWISHNILSQEKGVPYLLSYKFYKYININKTLIVIATV